VRYLILADIHANLQALEAVLAEAATVGFDATLCLGDLVGYGADPSAVISGIQALRPIVTVRGNHDKVCAGLARADDFNDAARAAIEWTQSVLSPSELATLAALPEGPLPVEDGLEVCHGSPFDEDEYLLEVDAINLALRVTSGICLFGHTHVPALLTGAQTGRGRPRGLVWSGFDGEPVLLPSGPCLVNVGAVGQPRDGDSRAAYGILDWDRRRLEARRVRYDVEGAQRRIIDAGLPRWLAERLALGQ